MTANEIQLIDNAISSSLGIIESAATALGRQTGTAAFDDLLQHLTNNKILLVIDNLETVVDQTITELVRQIPAGSRILFTTRIGLGAFNFPILIHPMNKRESASYFRSAARAWGVGEMSSATQPIVESFCERLQHNPLFIKSFMQSVKVGGRPSQLASEPKVLLQFCLQNVFNALPLEARSVARVLAGVTGAQSIASLSFYTGMESIGVQSALSFLITSNLVASERGRSSEDEDRFLLSA